ncbi:MAG: RHS repeat-associated core domain-containing protein, partial [Flavobacteriaceae bacterium]|nr:RHS repeat-associated core domain-containing protein [Flavobacteriaceae bacterium]
YDGLGRQLKEYLPYASNSSDGSFNQNAGLATQGYYQGKYANDFAGVANITDINSFSEKVLENSPLSRPIEQTAPGEVWKKGSGTVANKGYSDGHSIKLEYATNIASEVKYYRATTVLSGDKYTPSLSNTGDYSAGELTKTVTKDENWSVADASNHTTEEFTNKQGQVVLKRTYDNNTAHDTHYVYDNYGNLTYVLPPKVITSNGVSTAELNDLCYQYIYDTRSRLIEKKIPGKGWEYIIYDKLDRPILTQDANMRIDREWIFTKYDVFGRVASTGIFYHNTQSRAAWQDFAYLYNTPFESMIATPITKAGTLIYYTSSTFPTDYSEIHTINYYDTYVDLPSGFTAPTTVFGASITTNTKGLPTVSKTNVLGTTNWITTLTYYDDKARPVYVYSKNDYLQTTDIIESKLDFVGKVLETKTTHKKTGNADIVTVDRFEYDHQDRLLAQTQKVENHLTERVIKNNYDDLGQLESKLTGNGTQKGYTDVTSRITISNNVITKVGADGWNAGLATLGSIQGDGYLEYTVGSNTYFMVGLSDTNINEVWTTIDYAIYNQGSNIVIYENTVNRGTFNSFQIGDVFRVERIGDKIHYKQNGDTFYISQTASSGNLLGDISVYNDGTQIEDLHIVDNSKGLQNVDYDYNVRGWLKNINQDSNSDNDLFNFTLRYNDPTSGTALFNGNISQTSWNSLNTDSSTKTYTYSYDALNRILSGIDNTGNYNLTSVSYDKNGNIVNLQRQGHTNAGATSFGIMDNLSYTYDSGNKLTKVVDAGNTTYGFKDNNNIGNDFSYDVNGNMITDTNKGITNIAYNHLNLPTQVTINGQNIVYTYDATGVKQRKTVSGDTTDYAGNHVYENGTFQFFNHAEGCVKPVFASWSAAISSFDYIYQYKDHLGNVRLSYADSDGNGTIAQSEIIEESNYYPFGLKHKGYNNVSTSTNLGQKYGYQSKELNEELGLNWHDFGARNYDAALGRWMNSDPLAEEFYSYSPYNAMMNNPLSMIDPDGRAAMWIPKVNSDGSTSYIAEEGDSAQTLADQYTIGENNTEAEELAAAERITNSKGSNTIEEGTVVSGQSVINETGSEILKYDIGSKQDTNQRFFDNFLFARDHSTTAGEGARAFKTSKYFDISDYYGMSRDGFANISIGNYKFKLNFSIPIYRSASFDSYEKAWAYGNRATSRDSGESRYWKSTGNIYLEQYHPAGNSQGRSIGFITHNMYRPLLEERMSKRFPSYNYIRVNKKTKQ